MLSVEHDGQLLSSQGVLARHDCPRMRTVRNSARMQGNGTRFDPSSGAKIAPHVKEHFVSLYVVVHPWNLDCLWMSIEEARGKGANDVAPNLEGLMNRWRLMDGAGNWLKVLCIKGKRIDITVPAEHVERMVSVGNFR